MFDHEAYLLAKAEAKIVRYIAYRLVAGARIYCGGWGQPSNRDEAIRFTISSNRPRGYPHIELS